MEKVYAKGLTRKEYLAKYRKEHSIKIKDYSIKYRKEYPNKIYEWRKNNPEKLKIIADRYYEKRKEFRRRKSREWYYKNKQKRIDSNKLWRNKNTEVIKVYRHNRENLIKKGIKTGTINADRIKELIIYQNDICALCNKKMEGKYTLDHIVPLSKGGHHEIYNIQLAHHNCNAMKQANVLEKDIQKTICEYLTYRKHFWYRQNTGAFKTETGGFYRFGAKGSPDIVVVKEGKYIGLEVKTSTSKLSTSQEAFRDALHKVGALYYLVRSVDDVIALGL